MGYEGGCQCEGIRYRLKGKPIVVYACHCTACQKQSSSAFGISVWVPRADFQLLNGDLKFWVAWADSGNAKQCAFCPDCGTRIYHSSDDQSEILSVKGGALDDTRNFCPVGHIWTKSALPWALPRGKEMLYYPEEPENFSALIDRYRSARL